MSPKGSGLLFVREEHLERLWVNTASEDWRNFGLKGYRFACAVKGNATAARYTYECRTRGPQVDFLGATDAHAHRRESIPCR